MFMREINGITYEKLEEYMLSIGEKKYRAEQIFRWLGLGVSSFDEMTNLKKEFITELEKEFYFNNVIIEKTQVSSDERTKKFLLRLKDGNTVEAVAMHYKYGYSLCISTQVGCKMQCKFCATGGCGYVRDLTTAEMVSQVVEISKTLPERVSHIVLMGMGEPLDNFENVFNFLKIISHKWHKNISYRALSLSTCGIISEIERLMKEDLPITLSISLHASTQEEREQIMPIAKKNNINDLINMCRKYAKETGRRVYYEYLLLEGINDSLDDANRLSDLIRGSNSAVNIINYNEVKGVKYKKSKKAKTFWQQLKKRGITAHTRRELGSDIDAACGQLRGNSTNSL